MLTYSKQMIVFVVEAHLSSACLASIVSNHYYCSYIITHANNDQNDTPEDITKPH